MRTGKPYVADFGAVDLRSRVTIDLMLANRTLAGIRLNIRLLTQQFGDERDDVRRAEIQFALDRQKQHCEIETEYVQALLKRAGDLWIAEMDWTLVDAPDTTRRKFRDPLKGHAFGNSGSGRDGAMTFAK